MPRFTTEQDLLSTDAIVWFKICKEFIAWYKENGYFRGGEEIATSYITDNIARYYGGINMSTKMVNYRLRKVEKLGLIEMFSDRRTMTTFKLLNRNLEVL